MKLLSLTSLLAVVALAGCSSGPRPGNYECALREMGGCASVYDAYKASLGVTGMEAANGQSVFENRATGTVRSGAPIPAVGAQASGYPDVGEAGMPVFKQPKVLRVWVAPYVDADGNLRSGEYAYFSTPGEWNYGSLKKPGAAASSMFAPARQENLGFVPATGTAPRPAPAKPAELPKGDSPVTKPVAAGTPQNANAPAATITQPYQRLSGN